MSRIAAGGARARVTQRTPDCGGRVPPTVWVGLVVRVVVVAVVIVPMIVPMIVVVAIVAVVIVVMTAIRIMARDSDTETLAATSIA